ncbi:MAG: SPOR domain-containing protein, partial [Rhodobacteraceae bacterium]|nr:SPOR domain-containing protein [Paracoccaceae bacterium]
RQEVAEEAPAATEIAAATPATPPADAAAATPDTEAIAEAPPAAPADPGPAVRPVDDVATVVTSALDAAEADAATPAPQPAAAPRGFGADRPFLQIGLFSVEANAGRAADMLRASGIVPSTLKEDYQGKVFWRVVVGPITGRAERAALLDRARGVGFADAYFVAN